MSGEVQAFLAKLPATHLPVIVAGDSNSEITWGSRDDGSLSPFGRNGREASRSVPWPGAASDPHHSAKARRACG